LHRGRVDYEVEAGVMMVPEPTTWPVIAHAPVDSAVNSRRVPMMPPVVVPFEAYAMCVEPSNANPARTPSPW
jgi:hypothetical protein